MKDFIQLTEQAQSTTATILMPTSFFIYLPYKPSLTN